MCKNNDSVKHVQKVLLIVLFIYFQGKINFHTASDRSGCFEFLVSFCSAILLSKMKSLSINL